MSKGMQIAVGATLIAALLGWYTATTLEGGTALYYKNLDEFLVANIQNQEARLHGYVVPGSIQRDLTTKHVAFKLQSNPPHVAGTEKISLNIDYVSLETPDLFKDGAEIVVEGHLQGQASPAVFEASNLMAKCPSKFEAERTKPAPF